MLEIDKKGQAAGAAILLVVIAGLLIMFVILLPPQERAELLGENVTDSKSTQLDEAVSSKNILTVSPGRIDFLGQHNIEHPLPVVNIFTITESRVLAEKNVISARRAAFSDTPDMLTFTITDLDNTQNLLLSFTIEEIKGQLRITLNGERVYESAPDVGVIAPIRLPKNMLLEQNELVFSISSPGIAFWATHEAVLDDVKIVADVTDVAAQSSRSIFLISETEKNNLEKLTLKFQPDCIFEDVGKLTITVNGRILYSAVPDCDVAFVPIEFSPNLVEQGENEIVFHTGRGSYLLSHVVIQSELKEVDFPTYFFELSNEEYEEVQDGDKRVRLEVNFVDVVSRKFGEFIFNGHTAPFDTKEVRLVLDLSGDAVRGNNALKILPQRTLEIRELRVDLVK